MPSLTKSEASERTATITVDAYEVALDLTTGPDTFRSVTTIRFRSPRPGAGTFVDLHPDRPVSATLNGRPVDLSRLASGRLPLTDLAADNELVVTADMRYSNSNQGLHRYRDPADGEEYVYGFPYVDQAPRIFACFDQPDLKAPFTFTVTVPSHWRLFATAETSEVSPGHWRAGPTAPQATYLTTVAAGPFESFSAQHGDIRLGLHCRASLSEALKGDIDELFTVTRQCLDECRRLFGVAYPGTKFDQMFVPEFSVLSLDHPGLVLLREQYVFSSAASRSERETRAVVLAHGISLMWMAGLVTNAWWDDTWLGQVFADYLAHRITSEVTEFTGPPTTFAARRKGQAYLADQRPSTHPVSLEAEDVASALLGLDRISYFKGHSALRQLAATIGDDALRAGLRTYMERHAHSTATYSDFLTALGSVAGSGTEVDLGDWSDTWLRNANVNTFQAEITTEGGRITAAAVTQTAPPSHPVLRHHTLGIGLYGPDGRSDLVRAVLTGPRTELPDLVGLRAPDLLLLNDGDLTYAKIRFDAASLAALPRLLPDLSPINRAMVWCQLLLSVQDGVYPAASHVALVAKMVAEEDELSILTEVLEQARFDVVDRFLLPAERPEAMRTVASALRERLERTTPQDPVRLTLLRALIDFSDDTAELLGLLADDGADADAPSDPLFDGDLRWRIRLRLSVLGAYSAPDIARAHAREPGQQANEGALKCRSALPEAAAKEEAWNTIFSSGDRSNYEVLSLAAGFWQPEQADLIADYAGRFFDEAPKLAEHHGDLVLDLLVKALYPRHFATPATVAAARRLLASQDLPTALRRAMADQTDDLSRAAEARAVAARRSGL
ncbi:aminopeptidase N [Streptomyces sp. 8L]|uniref:aminopeptidase N n=1 Tax=Streptomyces sp. 8L TaxID=2877242 RepID=UPI001CD75529|nr:aminopeptidase N [Streptomyces sp. 8L]MCA1222136.1 aminopeptidase N [Streptomyces sp. 8L]